MQDGPSTAAAPPDTAAAPPDDPSHDLFRPQARPLDPIFSPRSVAVVGASERPGSVGRTILWNLISTQFGGTVYPVNPGRSSVLGIQAYPSVSAVPSDIDLAVVVTPAPTVPAVIRECAEKGVRGAIVISAGFKEIGAEGLELERRILEEARRGQMRIVGPNCLGVMRPVTGLNATFAGGIARPGNVAFISQSGALLTAILDWSFQANVGFSAFVSVGSMLDVGWGDLINHLGDDPRTQSILIYMESIGDAPGFLSAAREVALRKPIIVIKAGRTEQAAAAAASHTGTLTGSDEVLTAAFRRTGVLRVESIADLFYMAEVLAKQPRPKGPRLTILTNAGGPGVLATDALITKGGRLAALSEASVEAYNTFLPPQWSRGNPVDILGDAQAERYAQALEVAARDENSDGMLVVLTPQAMTNPTQIAEKLKSHAHVPDKPVLACWMGGSSVAAGEAILNDAGIPTFKYPDTAARVFNYMWQYSYNIRGIYETPTLPEVEEGVPDREAARGLIERVRSQGRTLLTEAESKQLLALYGLPTVETRIAGSPEDAESAAEQLGYPVVVKLHSYTITHKTDVGGVRLNLQDASQVRDAFEGIRRRIRELGKEQGFDGVTIQPMVRLEGYELIVGCSLDPQFGPVLLFGSGGSLVEVYRDRALALPPLTTTLAGRMMEQTRIYEAFHGVRGRGPVDLERLKQLMVQFSHLVAEQRMIREIDINPLLVSEDRLVALDARIVLHPPETSEEDLPLLAIHPYPQQYVGQWTTRQGDQIRIRPIRPEDEPMMVEFHRSLSENSVYLRYASLMKLSQRVAHERLARICFIDYAREMALVAERLDPKTQRTQIVAVGRLTKVVGRKDAEYALVVSDDFQQRGIGTEMLKRLIQVARDEGLDRITADILAQNTPMQRISRKLGFEIVRSRDPEDPMVKAVKRLH